MLVWLTFCKGTLKAQKLWSNLAALSSQLSHDNEIHSGLVLRLPPQHATLLFLFCFFFSSWDPIVTCKAKTIVTDNHISRRVEKKGFQKAQNQGITLPCCEVTAQKIRSCEGAENCCHEGVCGIKGIQVKFKKKKILYVTSEGIFISQGFTTEIKKKI